MPGNNSRHSLGRIRVNLSPSPIDSSVQYWVVEVFTGIEISHVNFDFIEAVSWSLFPASSGSNITVFPGTYLHPVSSVRALVYVGRHVVGYLVFGSWVSDWKWEKTWAFSSWELRISIFVPIYKVHRSVNNGIESGKSPFSLLSLPSCAWVSLGIVHDGVIVWFGPVD